ncbi:hypothetical protein DVH05_009418 [Phytophthora capsici]|nr:hypothetical protein DVH05_009418 [Phytophthora capsici]
MPPGRHRASVTAAEKLAVLDAWRQCGNINAVMAAFYSDLDAFAQAQRRKLLYQWRDKRKSIELACKTARGRAKKKARQLGTGTALTTEAEEELVAWVNELRGEGVPISSVMLHLKAIDVANSYEVAGFKPSWSWMKRFKARHRLSMRAKTRQGQTSPEDLDKMAADFSKKVAATVQDLGITRIFNADQTGALIFLFANGHDLNY